MKKIFLLLAILFFSTSCAVDVIENNEETIFKESKDSLNDEQNDVSRNFIVPEVKSIEMEIIDLINDYRLENGLLPLKLEKGFVKVKAKEHNLYMMQRKVISHDLFSNRANEIIKVVKAKSVAENVAFGFFNAKDLVDAWIASSGHRKTIVGDFNFFEISADQNSGGAWYFTNIFIKK